MWKRGQICFPGLQRLGHRAMFSDLKKRFHMNIRRTSWRSGLSGSGIGCLEGWWSLLSLDVFKQRLDSHLLGVLWWMFPHGGGLYWMASVVSSNSMTLIVKGTDKNWQPFVIHLSSFDKYLCLRRVTSTFLEGKILPNGEKPSDSGLRGERDTAIWGSPEGQSRILG